MSEVYKAIAAVQAELAKRGIAKDKRNAQQGYSFRGIDDVYGALAPVLSQHGLCFLPRVLTRLHEERQTKDGKPLNYVTVECEFDLVATSDASKHTIRTFGEAMDSADKATNKAMSAAYKYAAMQAFCIPVDGEPDGDADTHDVKPHAAARPTSGTRQESAEHRVPPADGTEEKGTLTAVLVDQAPPESGKDWTKYACIIDGQKYTTFDIHVGEDAVDLKGREVVFGWKTAKNPKFKDLIWIRGLENSNDTQEFDETIGPTPF